MNETRRNTASTPTGGRRDALAALANDDLDDLTRELQMRVALRAVDAPAMLVDLDGTVLDTNDDVVVFGFRREHLRGRPLWADTTWGDVDPTSAIAPPFVPLGSRLLDQ